MVGTLSVPLVSLDAGGPKQEFEYILNIAEEYKPLAQKAFKEGHNTPKMSLSVRVTTI